MERIRLLGEQGGDADRVSAVLLELHPGLAQQARDAAAAAGLSQVDVRAVDASSAEAYAGAVPADIVVMVGIFGNIADAEVWRLINFAPKLCQPRATLVWSRGRKFSRDPPGVTAGDINDQGRARFVAAGVEEVAYETHEGGGRPALGLLRYVGPAVDLQPVPSGFSPSCGSGPPCFSILQVTLLPLQGPGGSRLIARACGAHAVANSSGGRTRKPRWGR